MRQQSKKRNSKQIRITLALLALLLVIVLSPFGKPGSTLANGETGMPPMEDQKPHLMEIKLIDGQRAGIDADKIPLSVRLQNNGFSTSNLKVVRANDKGELRGVGVGTAAVYAGQGSLRVKIGHVRVIPKKVVYLTFDDGPSRNITPEILKILRENHIHATFFLVGQYVNYYPQKVRDIKRQGNAVGLHSDTHNYGQIYKNPNALLRDVHKLNKKVKGILHQQSHLYRFPGGSFEPKSRLGEKQKNRLVKALNEEGYRCFDWDVSLGDSAHGASPQAMFHSVRNQIGNKERVVILAHDMGLKKNTPAAMEKVIRYYKKQGYSFDTLDHYPGQLLFRI